MAANEKMFKNCAKVLDQILSVLYLKKKSYNRGWIRFKRNKKKINKIVNILNKNK